MVEHISKWANEAKDSSAPTFIKPIQVIGNRLVLRNANIRDAAFIVKLRTDKKIAKFISPTSADQGAQIEWLRRYVHDNSQVYFVIQDKNLEKVGTVRLYDRQGDSFCWGSWIIRQGTPSSFSIESALIVYHFALSLGFRNAHFQVAKKNDSVWRFHERFGATRVSEEEKFCYRISTTSISNFLKKYLKYLPDGISIELPVNLSNGNNLPSKPETGS